MSSTPATVSSPSLKHLPVSLFAAVMGVGGLGLSYRRASLVWGWPPAIGLWLSLLAGVIYLIIAGAYLTKAIRYPETVRAELQNPFAMTFAPAITVGMLIVATGLAEAAPALASVLWWTGAVAHLAITVGVLNAWMTRADIGVAQVTPAWFIPVVGNVITPLAAARVGSVEVGWLAFGVGLGFWVALLPLVGFRLVLAEQPMPQKLWPSLAILIAPPAIALLSLQALTGDFSVTGRVLWAMALAFTALLLVAVPRLRTVPFGVPAWAYTFPLTAVASAAIAVDGATGAVGYRVLALVLIVLATVVVTVVGIRTLDAVLRRRLFLPE